MSERQVLILARALFDESGPHEVPPDGYCDWDGYPWQEPYLMRARMLLRELAETRAATTNSDTGAQ